MLSTQRKQNGYWKDFANVERELREVEKKLGHFPTQKELMEIGKSSLVFAIGNYHKGINAVRERFGLTALQRPTGYWQNWENVERECRALIAQYGKIPCGRTLLKLGFSGLYQAIYDLHGGMPAIKEKLGLERSEKPKGYWKEWNNVEQEIEEIMRQLGHFPTLTELKNLRRSSLGFAMGNYHGGISAVRKLLGKENGVKPPGYWQEWTNTKQELQDTIQLLGHFPTQQELTNLRRSSLTMAMKYHGGVNTVRLRLQQEGILPSEQDQLEHLVEQYVKQ